MTLREHPVAFEVTEQLHSPIAFRRRTGVRPMVENDAIVSGEPPRCPRPSADILHQQELAA
jgi:hypothetical protein